MSDPKYHLIEEAGYTISPHAALFTYIASIFASQDISVTVFPFKT